MKNVLTILKRDFISYFTSPIGYIFMIVFLAISVGLYITTFFAYPVADMRGFFSNLPLLLCVFIPAVTMRVWAEERKENTWELLLTFPMRSWELVLGKFFATLLFFILTLACTFTVPLMLSMLGNPDNGAIIGGYLGTVLLGAFFLSIGIFFSGFCKDQIVAFVITLLVCFALFLLGTNMIAGYIDNLVPDDSLIAGIGTLLSQLVGVLTHYNAFTRGVVEVVDVLYFLVWTVLFLVLNIMYIDARSRPGARTAFLTAVTMCVVIGLAFNWLAAGMSLARFDLTERKIYTVSEASKELLQDVDDTVQIKLYITPREKMPTQFATLEQDIEDKLKELQIASNGKIQLNTIYLEAANVMAGSRLRQQQQEGEDEEAPDAAQAIEERMLDKGIQPFQVQAFEEDAMSTKLIYSHIGIGYKDKSEEIIPQVVPNILPELEYRIVSSVYKMTLDDQPVIAMVAPEETLNIPEEQRRMLMQMGQEIPQSRDPFQTVEQLLTHEKYDVQRVAFNKNEPLPDEYDTLVILNPRGLNDRQRWEINRAVVSGKPVFLAAQNHTYDYQMTRQGLDVSQQDENPQINPLIEKYGVSVDEGVLMDINSAQLRVPSGNSMMDMLSGGQPVGVATHMILTSATMAMDTSITSNLGDVFYLWGSALNLDDDTLTANGLDSKVLMQTTNQAANRDAEALVAELEDGSEQYPVMAMITGQFPDVYKGQGRPAWPEPSQQPGMPPQPPQSEEGEAGPIEPQPSKMIVLGGAMLFRENFLPMQGFSNMDLLLNSVDALSLDPKIAEIRSKKPVERSIPTPSDATRTLWKFVNYIAVNGVIALVGIGSAVARKRAREAYTISYQQQVGEPGHV